MRTREQQLNAAAVAMLGVLDREGKVTEQELCEELGVQTTDLIELVDRCPEPEDLNVAMVDGRVGLEVARGDGR